MAQSESIAALAQSLCEAQYEMESAKKDRINPHYKSHYADLSSVWDACRDALHKNGLAVVQAPEPWETGIRLRTVLIHKSGEWIDSVLVIPATQQTPQAFGSAMSYARRYALAALVGIVADEDDDGNAASTTPKQGTQRPSTNGGNGASYQPVPAPEGAWRPRFEGMLLDLYTEEVKLAISLANDLNCDEGPFLAQQKRDKEAHNLRTMSREAALTLYEATQQRVQELRAKLARPGQESSPKAPRAAS